MALPVPTNAMRTALAIVAGVSGTLGTGMAATILKTQPPCTVNATTVCVRFDWQTPPPQYLRQFTFSAPSAGSLLVLFQGSGNCYNADAVRRVADFDGQITTDPNEAPLRSGPGGTRVAFTLETYDPDTIVLTSLPFNLHANRIVAIPKAGKYHFYYRIAVNRMDTYVQCGVVNDAFSAVFTPK